MERMGSDPKAGRLLVATPLLGDPNFRRAVVLIVEHEEVEGTLGVVLNRPTAVGVGQVLEEWTELTTEPSVVFRGGPVAPNSSRGIRSHQALNTAIVAWNSPTLECTAAAIGLPVTLAQPCARATALSSCRQTSICGRSLPR